MTDPRPDRASIALGFILLALLLACCLATLLGWSIGGLRVLGGL